MAQFSISHVPALSTSTDASTTEAPATEAPEQVAEASTPPSTKHIKRAVDVKAEAKQSEVKAEEVKQEAAPTEEAKPTEEKKVTNSDDRIPDDETRRWYKKALGRAYESKEILAKKRDAAQVLAEQRATELQAAYERIAQLEQARHEVGKVEVAQKPNREAYDIPSEYAAAVAEWSAETTKQDVTRQLKQAQADTAIATAKQQIQASWQQQVQEASAKYPDFHQVALNRDLPINDIMSHRITTSPVGTDVLYYLGQNPTVAQRIASLPPIDAAAELGVLTWQIQQELASQSAPAEAPSAPVEAAPPPAPERKPAPMKPLSTNRGQTARKSPESESTEEYVARRTAQMYGTQRAERITRRK